jgi:DNA-binding PadR family transcriptional regulator
VNADNEPGEVRHHGRAGHHRAGRPADHAERRAHRHDRGFGRGRRSHHRGGRWESGWEGRRANRGDVRAAVLALLTEQPMHGYQMIQELSERSGGAWMPSPGSIYPALQLLQDEGLVSAAEADGKRVFTLTAAGRSQAESRADEPRPWEAAARDEGSSLGELRQLVGSVAAAVRQVAVAGDDRQVAKAVELLRSTRRDLYRLLADDGTAD